MAASAPADYRFLWRPWWIVSHVFVIACIIGFVNAGFWQLRRLDERRTANALIVAREESPAAPLTEVLPSGTGASADEVADVRYRAVQVTGTYRTDQQVLVPNRTYDSQPGFWVITPLRLADGSAVAINRGWVPFATTTPDGPWDAFAPPGGPVTVTGLARESQARSTGVVGGPKDASEGTLRELARVDLARLGQQVDEPLWPVYVDLITQDPPQTNDLELPVPVPRPDLSEGPHLGYAGQWFIFATLTVIVYPLLLRRTARREAAAKAVAARPDGDRPTDESAVPAAR